MFVVGFVAIMATAVQSITMPRQLNGQKELVQLNFKDSFQQGRFRRSLDTTHQDRTKRFSDGGFQFHEQLIFTVTIDNATVTLMLQLSHVNDARPPVYVYDDNGDLVRKDVVHGKRYALYQDVNSGASYMVTCEGPDPEQCSLHGSFYHRQNKYQMTAHSSFPSTGLHEVEHLGEDRRDFGNDALLPPDSVRNENTKPENGSRPARPKRALPDANIVELLALPDESVYQAFLDQTGSEEDAEDAISLYYSLLCNEIDLHYLSVAMVDPGLNIRVALASVIIAKNTRQAQWSSDNTVILNGKVYLNANGALNGFTNWRNGRPRSGFPTHDHAMAFTMKDFEYINGGSASQGLAGQAWLDQVCRSWDTSITEDDGHRTANTAAHELGHSLGAQHDSSTACPREARNIMTSTLYVTSSSEYAEAQWTFSSCSVSEFRDHINSLSTNCMRYNSIPDNALDEPLQLPGEYYTLDQQCQMRDGDSVRACPLGADRVSDWECHYGIRCDTSCGAGSFYRFYVLAGTPCGGSGENKWCYKGLCVERTTQPSTVAPPTTTTPSPCEQECCKKKKKKTKCCTGKRCCRKRWGKKLPCCTECKKLLG